MSRIWTAPKTWEYKDALTASLYNAQLRDNLEFLKMKPRQYADLRGVANDAPTVLTASWTAINDTNWVCSITTSEVDEEVFIYFGATFVLTTAAQRIDWDILIDNNIYLSSLTATAFTNGVGGAYVAVSNAFYFAFRHRYVVPTVGTHTFKLRAKTTVSNSVVTMTTATSLAIFGVQVE